MLNVIYLLSFIFLAVIITFVLQKIGGELKNKILLQLINAQQAQQQSLADYRNKFDEHQFNSLKVFQDSIHKGMQETRSTVREALVEYSDRLGKQFTELSNITHSRLKEINDQVEKRLVEGFDKTNTTFNDVVKRLALIDAAQKQIMDLSQNVVSLQDILNDKRSRGAFGEVQLTSLIRNMLPEHHFAFQHSLSNNKRADCILFLPEPTGNIVIDAKFPLESFRGFMENNQNPTIKTQAESQFKKDIKKHILDIAEKYIIEGETADGAMMFIPAEAIFAEIHARHPELVELANHHRIWMVSPTTMMAILTTARSVLKDTATRKQLNIIQDHLRLLSVDFKRFQKRMDDVAHHINKAHSEVDQVNISAKKISRRFEQIEQVDLEDLNASQKLKEALPVD